MTDDPNLSLLGIYPLGERVLLRRIPMQSHNDLVIAEQDGDDEGASAGEFTQYCEVLKVGASVTSVVLAQGARVFIARHTGYGLTLPSGERLIVVEAKDVLCILCVCTEEN